MRVKLAQFVNHQRCLDVATQPYCVFLNGRQSESRKEKAARSMTARLWRSNRSNRLHALRDVSEYTRQQGNVVPLARARVSLKRVTACTTRKAEPSGRTVSKVCHVCLLSLPHHREPSTRLARRKNMYGTSCSMPWQLQASMTGSISEGNWLPHTGPRVLVRFRTFLCQPGVITSLLRLLRRPSFTALAPRNVRVLYTFAN